MSKIDWLHTMEPGHIGVSAEIERAVEAVFGDISCTAGCVDGKLRIFNGPVWVAYRYDDLEKASGAALETELKMLRLFFDKLERDRAGRNSKKQEHDKTVAINWQPGRGEAIAALGHPLVTAVEKHCGHYKDCVAGVICDRLVVVVLRAYLSEAMGFFDVISEALDERMEFFVSRLEYECKRMDECRVCYVQMVARPSVEFGDPYVDLVCPSCGRLRVGADNSLESYLLKKTELTMEQEHD